VLTVGVHNTQYAVKEEDEVDSPVRFRPKTSSADVDGNAETINPLMRETVAFVPGPHGFSPSSSSNGTGKRLKSKRLEVSRVVGPQSYIMGIIDFQQQWNFRKKVFYSYCIKQLLFF
jgi:hypothetical protein